MAEFMNSGAVRRLEGYFARIGEVLGSDGRRASFARYARGLFGEAERKSVEPIAAQACGEAEKTDAEHQRLLHFLGNSPWSDRDVRREAARYALAAMTDREPIEAWIVDDTGFLKQGEHSVGVQRQYTGTAGKITNCQVATSLSVATRTEHLPIDFELYLPTSWTEDPARRSEARIPDSITFKTKPELALDMIRRAAEDGVPSGVLLADAAYGSSRDFRDGVRELGLHYIVGVDPKTVVAVFDRAGRRRDDPVSVRNLAFRIETQSGFRRCTWRKGTKQDLSARFALRRIVPAYDQCYGMEHREPLWLLIEWRDGDTEPAGPPRRFPQSGLHLGLNLGVIGGGVRKLSSHAGDGNEKVRAGDDADQPVLPHDGEALDLPRFHDLDDFIEPHVLGYGEGVGRHDVADPAAGFAGEFDRRAVDPGDI